MKKTGGGKGGERKDMKGGNHVENIILAAGDTTLAYDFPFE